MAATGEGDPAGGLSTDVKSKSQPQVAVCSLCEKQASVMIFVHGKMWCDECKKQLRRCKKCGANTYYENKSSYVQPTKKVWGNRGHYTQHGCVDPACKWKLVYAACNTCSEISAEGTLSDGWFECQPCLWNRENKGQGKEQQQLHSQPVFDFGPN